MLKGLQMSYSRNYTVQDIENFLEIDRLARNETGSKSLQKLLSVQDKISIFKNIDPLELRAIVSDVKFVKFKHKDYVVKENDESKEIFFIINGECQVFHNNNKIGTLKPGIVFGETGAIFKTKRNASVVCASEDATLLSFCIDEENMEFCAPALATLYKNLAFQINYKLENLNQAVATKK
jgi:CRP-like cAMP-binding protein